MDNSDNVLDDVKSIIQEQFKAAYMDGVHQGAISACAIIYETMRSAGLEEDNFLFQMLKDIAETHGCSDLPATISRIKENH